MSTPTPRFPPLPRTLVAHLVSPQRIGDVNVPHAAGEVGSMVGGFGVRATLFFAHDGPGVAIGAARGRAFGSAAPIPALSWMAARIEGRSPREALELTPAHVIEALADANGAGLTQRVRLGAEMVVKAFRRALGDVEAGPPSDPTGPGMLVCRCLGVGDRTIRAAIRAGAHDPESIGLAAKACTGCRSCRTDLLALLDEERGQALPEPDPERHPVERITLARAGPLLRSLGATLRDAVVEADAVRLHLGPFGERPLTTALGAAAITRHLLRETVWDGARVLLGDELPA